MLRILVLTLAILPLLGAGASAAAQRIVLARDGTTDYVIVVAADAPEYERHAASDLAHFIGEATGAKPAILDDSSPASPAEILVGNSSRVAECGIDFAAVDLGKEGFIIRTVGGRLVIAGGRPRGTLYGVYTFLEDYVGCRWFAPEATHVAKFDSLALPAIDRMEVPALEYREVFYTSALDGDWAVRNKLNGSFARLDSSRGGKIAYSHFVHTFYALVPPDEFFESHPEYFALVGGKRRRQGAQLCLTNPDVVRITTERVREWMHAAPEATIFSVSQNDGEGGFCECPECAALDEREGSHAGTMINFVNQIAAAVEEEFPDKYIDTLAYFYSMKPPATLRPRHNVIVRLCSIVCCRRHPIAECSMSTCGEFYEALAGWSRIAPKVYVWDYVTNFNNYIQPFPNWQVLAPNVRLFVENNVKGVFEQGNYSPGGGGEFAELRAWLLAKLLWNRDYDVEKGMREFLAGYYGPAAPMIGRYIEQLETWIPGENPDRHMRHWDLPEWVVGWIGRDSIERALDLFDQAEGAVADKPEFLKRARVARLPMMYLKMATSEPEKLDRKLVDRFFKIAHGAGITHINEWVALSDYEKSLRKP